MGHGMGKAGGASLAQELAVTKASSKAKAVILLAGLLNGGKSKVFFVFFLGGKEITRRFGGEVR